MTRITVLLVCVAMTHGLLAAEGQPVPKTEGVDLQQLATGEWACKTPAYTAIVGLDGNLKSLDAGGTPLLAQAAGSGPAAGFVHAGQFVPVKNVRQTAPDTLVAEGEPKDPAKAFVGSPCPLTARVTYRFLPDRIELTLEESMELYASFAWVPAASVVASRDALTDCATKPEGLALYGQTDPRWTTKEGPVLRFDFGVWQKSFANANWGQLTLGDKPVRYMASTALATVAMKAVAYPLPHPGPADALTFDISAASPDFLLPGGKPVHFDIKVQNAGPDPVAAHVRFEVRDYLTQKPVAANSTLVMLGPREEMTLPTDLKIKDPGPYRAAIVVTEAGKETRSFWWLFAYDFQHYSPPNTRAADFEKFWRDALAESAATPMDLRMTKVPEKSSPSFDAFKISFATLGGRRIYGWYARPTAPGKHPAHIRFPSSGIYPLPGPEADGRFSCLWIQIHGFDVDLSNMPAGDDPGKGYWTAGIESPKTSMWRTIYISLVRSVDFMLAQPEVDPARVAVFGGSQGGGLAMVAAGLDHRIALSMPYHSGLPRLDWTVKHEPGYWPFAMGVKPAGQTEEQFLRTLSYFDAANFTQDIRCPIVAEVGLMDTVTAAGNQICALAHVPKGLLYLICSPWAMHGAGSRAPNLGGECWDRFLKGQKPFDNPTRP
jgi:cephalosporin-C deacetylase